MGMLSRLDRGHKGRMKMIQQHYSYRYYYYYGPLSAWRDDRAMGCHGVII
jgi:hypothetical protein